MRRLERVVLSGARGERRKRWAADVEGEGETVGVWRGGDGEFIGAGGDGEQAVD